MARKTNRRRFLTALVTSIAGAGLAPVRAATSAPAEPEPAPKSNGYRESPHVRRYYASTSMKD